MFNRNKTDSIWANPHLWRIIIIMVFCSIYYYLDVFAGFFGLTLIENTFGNLHDFHGLVFFIPVVYTAYVFGLAGSLITALAAMVILYPYAIIVTPYTDALYRPTAFGIILSAIGATISFIQRADKQRCKYTRELKCLHGISNVSEESYSIDNFLLSAAESISKSIQYPERTSIRITVKGKAYESEGFSETTKNVGKTLIAGGNVLGNVEAYFNDKCRSITECNTLMDIFAERISAAVLKIELEQSIKIHTAN